MVASTARAIVLVPFPFSDLAQSKLRPAVVLAEADRGDCILCQITSNPYGDSQSIALTNAQLTTGSLHRASYVRPSKLFTANRNLIQKEIGTLTADAFRQIVEAIVHILRSSMT